MNKSLLPQNYQDKNNIALEECMKQAFSVDLKKFLIFPIENVQENLLPYLAKENHISGYEGWNLAVNSKEKRDLLANSLIIHTTKGTIESIKNALKKINIECQITEFQDYGGRPAHFKIDFLNLYNKGYSEELETALIEMIRNYAPKSRILDSINYYLCSIGKVFTYASLKTIEKTTLTTKGAIK